MDVSNNIVNKFNVFNDNEIKDLVIEIKLFYLTKEFLLFQTNDDSVYQYNTAKKQLKKLNAFYENKCITKFDCSNFKNYIHFLALTDYGGVYSWGSNNWAQLGNGYVSDYCDEPKLINGLCEDFITDICCGQLHSLALTSYGEVYAFGHNKYGQCGNNSTLLQSTPVKINLSNIRAISCGNEHSIALTQNGEVFGWGRNHKQQLGSGGDYETQPKSLNTTNIEQIICGKNFTLMRSSDGYIFISGNIDCSHFNQPVHKICYIAATIHSRLSVAVSEDNERFIFGKYRNPNNEIVDIKEPQQTKLSVEDTYAFHEQITYKSIKLNQSKYRNNFREGRLLGSQWVSTVFKCHDKKNDNKMYAIKKISFERKYRERVLREREILNKLQSNYVVNCIDSWIERNYYLDLIRARNPHLNELLYDPNKTQLLHIQMELCSCTLKDAINKIVKECSTPIETLSLVGYYISSELLLEILECVNYLHTQNPAIIHRDLKPENILLVNFVDNKFVKLSDFGLSTFHEFSDQSHTKYVGTRDYRAPEIATGKKYYDTKADVYSLGIIMEQLFQLDYNNENQSHVIGLEEKMKYMLDLIKMCCYQVIKDRPTCIELLHDNHKWLLTNEQLLNDRQFNEIINKTPKANSIEENFVEFFIQNKYSVTRNRIIQRSELSPLIKPGISVPTPMVYE